MFEKSYIGICRWMQVFSSICRSKDWTIILVQSVLVHANGRDASTQRVINVLSSLYLVETTGYELFSPFNTTGSNIFNFDCLGFMNLSENPASGLVQFTEINSDNDVVITRTLGSLSCIKFFRTTLTTMHTQAKSLQMEISLARPLLCPFRTFRSMTFSSPNAIRYNTNLLSSESLLSLMAQQQVLIDMPLM